MKCFRSNPIKLNEAAFIGPEEISDDIQILRTGTFFHEGQAIEVDRSHLKNMVDNFKKNVRGIDLMLDFSHNSEGEAAAWFEDLYLSEDGKELWAKVSWTESGASSVRKREYRYISADFNFAYKDNETLREFGPTLLGAGLTNRPVVKKMNPTVLSEKNNKVEYKEGDEMELEEMKKEVEKLKEENKELKEMLAEKEKKMSEADFEKREKEVKEREDAIKLAEEKAQEEKELAEKKGEFDKMLSEGKAVEAQRDAFMESDMAKFIENAPKVGTLNLSEGGHGGSGTSNPHEGSETPAQDEVISLAEKKAKEDGIDIGNAIKVVLSENPKLQEKYNKEVEE